MSDTPKVELKFDFLVISVIASLADVSCTFEITDQYTSLIQMTTHTQRNHETLLPVPITRELFSVLKLKFSTVMRDFLQLLFEACKL